MTSIAPLRSGPSHLVARYLFPTEQFRGEWKRHSLSLTTPITVAVIGTIALGVVAGFFAGVPFVLPIAILAWLLALAYSGWRVLYWHFYRFILTDKRLMLVKGVIARDVAMMPLGRVTDMKYTQTPNGRIFNYGTFVIESAGQDQALREIAYLPSPNELYLQVVEEMYEPEAVAARLRAKEEPEADA